MILEIPDNSRFRDDSLIPLINIVFLLLAFFMIVGQIQESDPDRVVPPDSTSEKALEEYRITLLITAENKLMLNSDLIKLDDLGGKITRSFERLADPSKLRVLVKADAQLPADELRTVLSHLRTAGLTQVSLATLPSRL